MPAEPGSLNGRRPPVISVFKSALNSKPHAGSILQWKATYLEHFLCNGPFVWVHWTVNDSVGIGRYDAFSKTNGLEIGWWKYYWLAVHSSAKSKFKTRAYCVEKRPAHPFGERALVAWISASSLVSTSASWCSQHRRQVPLDDSVVLP